MKSKNIFCIVLVLALAVCVFASAAAYAAENDDVRPTTPPTGIPTTPPTGIPTTPPTEPPVDPGSIAVPVVLSRVADENDKYVVHRLETADGVMTVTAERDFASFTNKVSTLDILAKQGVEKIVFVTNGAASEFMLSDLLEKTADAESYKLTHDGESVSFFADDADISEILIGEEKAE